MSDILIRDVPDEVLRVIDARAAELGISRAEYVRRRLAQEAAAVTTPVSRDDLTRFAETFADLASPEVMAGAWD